MGGQRHDTAGYRAVILGSEYMPALCSLERVHGYVDQLENALGRDVVALVGWP